MLSRSKLIRRLGLPVAAGTAFSARAGAEDQESRCYIVGFRRRRTESLAYSRRTSAGVMLDRVVRTSGRQRSSRPSLSERRGTGATILSAPEFVVTSTVGFKSLSYDRAHSRYRADLWSMLLMFGPGVPTASSARRLRAMVKAIRPRRTLHDVRRCTPQLHRVMWTRRPRRDHAVHTAARAGVKDMVGGHIARASIGQRNPVEAKDDPNAGGPARSARVPPECRHRESAQVVRDTWSVVAPAKPRGVVQALNAKYSKYPVPGHGEAWPRSAPSRTIRRRRNYGP